MKIFVLHYSKLTDRKKHIIDHFQKQNIIDYEFIEKYNQEDLKESDILLFDNTSLSKSQISLFNKHFFTYNLIAEKYENALIFEDDVILCDNFMNILNKYMDELPVDYDMLYIGDGCNLHIQNEKLINNQFIYEKCLESTDWGGDGSSRCADSYIISKKCALHLCQYINILSEKIMIPLDWWLNVAARDNNFKVYWTEPTIVTQGSQNGKFNSTS